jgi:hypothetical protein
MAKQLPQVNYARLTSSISVGIGTPRTLTASYVVGIRQGTAYHDLPAWCLAGSGTGTVSGPGTTSIDAGLQALASAVVAAESLVSGDQILNTDGAVLLTVA